MKKQYTVKELAKISGVTVRTLHYYDELDLLQPKSRSNAGYRCYGDSELLKLQQILFYRELEFSLQEIKKIVNDPEFDPKKALESHRVKLLQKRDNINDLVKTIDQTLLKLEGSKMVTNKDLYEGFSPEKIKKYEEEVDRKYDAKIVAESKKNLGKMTKKMWIKVKNEGDLIAEKMATAMKNGHAIDSKVVQTLVRRHHQWIENFYACPKKMYLGLGDLYISNPEFCAFYEKFGKGLAQFLNLAMKKYVEKLPA